MFRFKKAAAVALAAVMSTGLLAGCGESKIDGSKTLITVNDEMADLGLVTFYARFQQAQMYTYWGSYFGQNGLFDDVVDEESGKTYGEQIKDTAVNDVTKMLVISQHASEYNVELTDEQKTAISEAAQAYIDANDQETLDKIGASKEDVEQLLMLQTIQSLMMDPIVADVDTNVPDDEVQQSSVSYVEVEIKQESENAEAEDAEAEDAGAEDAEAAESEDAAAEEADATEAEDAEATEADTENADAADAASEENADASKDTTAVDAAKADAQAILDKLLAADDPATADLDALAKEVNEDYSSSTGNFTVSDTTDTYLDAKIVEAVANLKDGEVVKEPVISDDGESYFVVRMDKVFDEEATESKRSSKIIERKQNKFNEVTDAWVEEAKDSTKVDEKLWATITLTDAEPFSLRLPAAGDETSEDEDAGEQHEDVAEAAEAETAEAEPTEAAEAETTEAEPTEAAEG